MSSSPNPNPNSPPETLTLGKSEKNDQEAPKNRPKSRKKALHKKKQQAIEKKVQYLTKTLNPIPFKPLKTLDLTEHENLLKNLGLWEFIHIEYDKNIRMDLITQLIVTYESKKRCGYVNGCRISLNRGALGNALKLSTEKKEKRKNSGEICDIVDVDTYDGEIISFMESLVMTYLVLCGDVPNSVLSEIKSGHFERVDWCGLIWGSVEKEISQGVKLVNCCYGLHLQYLICSQNNDLFVLEEFRQGVKLENCYHVSHLLYLSKAQYKDVYVIEETEVLDEEEADVEVRESEDVGLDKAIELDTESVVVEEPKIEVTLGKEHVENEDMDAKETKETDMMMVDESKDDLRKGGILDGKNSTGGQFLKSCDVKGDTAKNTGEESKDDVSQDKFGFDGEKLTVAPILQSCNMKEDMVMNADEETKLEEEGEQNIEEDGERNFEEDGERNFEEDGKRNFEEGEMASDGGEEDGMKIDESNDYEEEEEEDEMKLDEGDDEEEDDHEFSLTPRIHNLGHDGYAGNLLQGIDSNNLAYNVSGQFDDQSNMGIILPKDEPYSSSGGPSFFGNGMKRAISHDYDLMQDHLGGGSKRLKMVGSSSEPDFDMCMDQIQLWLGKAKDKYEGKRKDVEELSKNQQFWINEVQQREQLIEHLHKIKYDELQKKDVEIDRLDRELFVMGNLINGYRDALKATDKKFAEYRERCQLPEESIYKDVGPGGLVLSTMEIERQRLKREEEDRVKRVILEQDVKQSEEGFVVTFEGYLNQLQMMDTKLLDLEKRVSQLKTAKHKVLVTVDSAAPVE